MTTELAGSPSEQDLQAVEAQLAALYAALPPTQQGVVATVIAAGVETLAGAETRGYYDVEALYAARRLELEQVWQRADAQGHHDRTHELATATTRESRTVFGPLRAFFQRLAATDQPRPAGGHRLPHPQSTRSRRVRT
jgi:hypothetical protein